MSSFYETIFLKEDSSLEAKVELLKKDRYHNSENIYKLEKGIAGEKQLMYHLSKANVGMYVLRDVNFAYEGLKAQVDFIVVTSHHCYFIECKNHKTNAIHVDQYGNFEYSKMQGKKAVRIGVKSPITQVKEQFEVFKKICLKENEKFKDDYFKTLVVFTDPENKIRKDNARKDIKYRVLKVDNLISQIEYDEKHFTGNKYTKEQMKQIAENILDKNVDIKPEDIPVSYYINQMSLNNIEENKKPNISTAKSNTFLSKFGKILWFIIVLAILGTIGSYYSDKTENKKNKATNIIYPATLTTDQTKALNVFKAAYDDSKVNGFTIVHTSICYEISKMFNKGNVCASCCNVLPIEVNIINDRQLTFYKAKTNKCSTITLSVDGKSIENAISETKECHGQPVGMVEWDNENEYYKKIGGYDQIKKMAIDSYNDQFGTFDVSFFDQSHIGERGGNINNYSGYVQDVNMFFAGINGKNAIRIDTTKKNFNKMVESYYYIMK